MFATQLKELESRCGDIAQICCRVSVTELMLGIYSHHSYWYISLYPCRSNERFRVLTASSAFSLLQRCVFMLV